MTPDTGKELRKNLRSHRRREDAMWISALALLVVTTGIIASLTSFLVFSPIPYVFFAIPLVLGILWFFSRPGVYKNARLVEKADPSWKDRLSTAVDLSVKDNPKEVYSAELTNGYVKGIEKKLNTTRLPFLDGKKGLFYSSMTLGAAIVLAIICLFTLPHRLRFGAQAVFAPNELDLSITAITADTLVNPGKYLEVEAEIYAPIELIHVFLIRENTDGRKRVKVALESGKALARIRLDSEEHLRFTRLGKTSGGNLWPTGILSSPIPGNDCWKARLTAVSKTLTLVFSARTAP